MERHFEQDLERIKTTMLRMGGMVEEMVGNDLAVYLGRSELIPWRQNWKFDVPQNCPPVAVRLLRPVRMTI